MGEGVSEGAGAVGVLIYPMDTEQGFTYRVWGEPSYVPEEFDGLMLVRRLAKAGKGS
ncbi:MAG: hypothetical protein KatS3mg061_1853 [Dehalococcoidia bacterium]|nr:MAG: hypothetical protein KatS3mg061_1853 [Dehalococcoidia bacterium]